MAQRVEHRGGSRPGSGRKACAGAKKTVSVRLNPGLVAKIKEHGSATDLITRLLEEFFAAKEQRR